MSARFPCPTYLITDGSSAPETFSTDKESILSLVRKAVDFSISMVQLREKHLTGKQLFHIAREAVAITGKSDTKLLVNDRADIALAAGADGVHLTSASLPASVIRKNFPARFIIGVSTHSRKKALLAKDEGADFITFGPVFPTGSKLGYGAPQGAPKLAEVVKTLEGFPVFALGGINAENYRELLTASITGIAGISMFYKMLE